MIIIMDNLIIGLIIAVIALPFYFGLKKIAAMFGSKNSCGCGKSDCGCGGSAKGVNKVSSSHESSQSCNCQVDKSGRGSLKP